LLFRGQASSPLDLFGPARCLALALALRFALSLAAASLRPVASAGGRADARAVRPRGSRAGVAAE